MFPPTMRRLINELSKLPSVGEKTATRLAYHLLTGDNQLALDLAKALTEARDKTKLCEICFALTETEICALCQDAQRNRSVVCVVEKPVDVLMLEMSRGFHGLYHVLHGLWSPLRGIGPDKTTLPQLIERIESRSTTNGSGSFPPIEELVVATGTTVEGDATALYIANSVQALDIRVTRIAQGLPKGGELEYSDALTISHAIEGRKRI